LALLAVVALLGACSSGGRSPSSPTTAKPPVLRADLVPAAVAAVQATRGGLQQYTEINAFDQGVNVFVAVGDGNEVAYVYRDAGLDPPAPPQAAVGARFGVDGV